MKKTISLIHFSFILFLFNNCSDEHLGIYSNQLWQFEDQFITKANFQGFVFDMNYQPLSGAEVKVGNQIAYTNEFGIFFIDAASVSLSNAVITISKPGYFKCVKSLRLSAGDDNVIKVQMVERKLSGNFPSKDGGTISLQSGTSLSIPANGLIDSLTGQIYNGNVKVYMHWLDPSNVNILYQMPGELRGITSLGEERMMITYGMTTVELEGESGQKLQLAKGALAKLIFEVPTEMELNAPQNIPLWYYNEEKGRWFEEGMAKLVNGKYEGNVKHFSTWNCDAPYEQPMLKFCLKVKDEYDIPYANVHVLVRRANDRWGGHGFTNGQGVVCGLIPANTPLILEILGEPGCDQTFLSKPIGPYKTDVELDSVVVMRNPEKMITVSGTVVDCNGNPVKEGYVQAKISYKSSIGKVIDGKFEFNVGRCPADNEATILGIDTKSKKITDNITKKLTGNKLNFGTIKACGDIPYGILTDIEGNVYRTIKIGNQIWMAENLKVTKFRNGDPIENVTDPTVWSNLNSPGWCYYNNDSKIGEIYGKLYNSFTISDNRGIAPIGWHVPSSTEWQELFSYLGGINIAGGKMKEIGTSLWQSPNYGATNISFFSGLPGGFRANFGGYMNIGQDGWWMTTNGLNPVGFWNLRYDLNSVNVNVLFNYYNYLTEKSGISIRCVKN